MGDVTDDGVSFQYVHMFLACFSVAKISTLVDITVNGNVGYNLLTKVHLALAALALAVLALAARLLASLQNMVTSGSKKPRWRRPKSKLDTQTAVHKPMRGIMTAASVHYLYSLWI